MKLVAFFAALFALLLAAHLCHSGLLWTEEGLPMAAARQMLFGKVLYRDAWFDKPPLVPAIYLLWGVRAGWLLRLAGSLYGLTACVFAFLLGRRVAGGRAGYWSGGLLCFFLIFDTPSAVMPLAADLLTLVPHLAAVYFAVARRPVWSGICAGIAFLFNAKAVFVAAACAVFAFPAIPGLALGFLIPTLAAAALLFAFGAWQPYVDQVWIWMSQYAGSPVVSNPVAYGAVRTLNWLGFHAALLVPAVCYWFRRGPFRWKLLAWALLSLAAVAMGGRFFPRYYFQLLPALVILAAAGLAAARHRVIVLASLALLLIPAIRFGPRYFSLALGRSGDWSDTAMDRESRRAAAIARSVQQPGDTLFVWGFRPDLFVYTGLPAGTRFLDCQALTGVPADRHLTQSTVVLTGSTGAAREELASSAPSIVIDGLSLYNPALALGHYPELREWLARYREVGRTGNTVVYQRKP